MFARPVRIDWNGEIFEGNGREAAAFWTRQFASSRNRSHLYFHRVVGESADRVVLTGELSRSVDLPGGGNRSELATIEQIWTRNSSGEMRLERMTISPWREG